MVELCANTLVEHLKPGQDLVRSWVSPDELVGILREQYKHPHKKWLQFPFVNEREKRYVKEIREQIEEMNLPWCLFGMEGIDGLLEIAEHPVTKSSLLAVLSDEYDACSEMSADELVGQ